MGLARHAGRALSCLLLTLMRSLCLVKDVFLLHAALREALVEGLGEKLVTSFLAVHKSELEWTKALKKDSSSTDDYIGKIAAALYDRY